MPATAFWLKPEVTECPSTAGSPVSLRMRGFRLQAESDVRPTNSLERQALEKLLECGAGAVDRRGRAGQLDEVRPLRCFDDARPHAKAWLVVPLGRTRANFGDVGAADVEIRQLQSVDRRRRPHRRGSRLELRRPALQIRFDGAARPAEVID